MFFEHMIQGLRIFQSIYLQRREMRIIEMKNMNRHEIPEGSTHSILTVMD